MSVTPTQTGPLAPLSGASRKPAGPAAGADSDPAARKAAQQFEAVFLGQSIDQMMKTVKMGGLDGGSAEATWKSFLAHELAEDIAKTGTTGIAQSIEKMLKAYKG